MVGGFGNRDRKLFSCFEDNWQFDSKFRINLITFASQFCYLFYLDFFCNFALCINLWRVEIYGIILFVNFLEMFKNFASNRKYK